MWNGDEESSRLIYENECEREHRERLLSELRSKIKSNKAITYSDIASSAGVSSGWVGEVLRGNYRWRSDCWLPKNIADALNLMGFEIPQKISTFEGGQGRSEPMIEEWISKNVEALRSLPHPFRAKMDETLEDYLRWMLDHAGSIKRQEAFENAKTLVEEVNNE